MCNIAQILGELVAISNGLCFLLSSFDGPVTITSGSRFSTILYCVFDFFISTPFWPNRPPLPPAIADGQGGGRLVLDSRKVTVLTSL
jgi:hypothetical protein